MNLKRPTPKSPPGTQDSNLRKLKREATDKEINSVIYVGLMVIIATVCLIGMGIYFIQSLG